MADIAGIVVSLYKVYPECQEECWNGRQLKSPALPLRLSQGALRRVWFLGREVLISRPVLVDGSVV